MVCVLLKHKIGCHGNIPGGIGKTGPDQKNSRKYLPFGMGDRYLNVHVNSVNDTSISCKYFVKFGPVTPEKLFVRHGKKLAYLVEYLRMYRPIYTIFLQYESDLGADDRPLPRFPIMSRDVAVAIN